MNSIKKKECPDGKILNPKTNRCINKNLTKIDKKPISLNNKYNTIYDRHDYYKLMIKNIDNDPKNTDYCINFNKYNNLGKPIFTIGDKFILKERLDNNDSRNSVTYLSNYIDKSKKLNNFAIRISANSLKTIREEKILRTLNNLVLKDICPHFPLFYTTFKCDNFLDFKKKHPLKLDTDTQNFLEIKNKKSNSITIYPKFIRKNKKNKMLIFLNELATGNLNTFIKDFSKDSVLLENALAQVYFAIMFFHNKTGMYHNDAHWNNFLYYKIKPGGYFHYKIFNEDYYIENLGYLWIISDFDLATPFNEIKEYIARDYYRIIHAFITYEMFTKDIPGWAKYINIETQHKTKHLMYPHLFFNFDGKNPLAEAYYTPENMNNFIKRVLDILCKYDFIKTSSNIKKNHIIINKKPYILNYYK